MRHGKHEGLVVQHPQKRGVQVPLIGLDRGTGARLDRVDDFPRTGRGGNGPDPNSTALSRYPSAGTNTQPQPIGRRAAVCRRSDTCLRATTGSSATPALVPWCAEPAHLADDRFGVSGSQTGRVQGRTQEWSAAANAGRALGHKLAITCAPGANPQNVGSRPHLLKWSRRSLSATPRIRCLLVSAGSVLAPRPLERSRPVLIRSFHAAPLATTAWPLSPRRRQHDRPHAGHNASASRARASKRKRRLGSRLGDKAKAVVARCPRSTLRGRPE